MQTLNNSLLKHDIQLSLSRYSRLRMTESVRGAPGHVTNPGHLKMHHPGASRMLRCTALRVHMMFTAIDTLRHTWPNYQKKYVNDTRFVYKGMF